MSLRQAFNDMPLVARVYHVVSVLLVLVACYYVAQARMQMAEGQVNEAAAVIGSCTCYHYTGAYTCALLRGPK